MAPRWPKMAQGSSKRARRWLKLGRRRAPRRVKAGQDRPRTAKIGLDSPKVGLRSAESGPRQASSRAKIGQDWPRSAKSGQERPKIAAQTPLLRFIISKQASRAFTVLDLLASLPHSFPFHHFSPGLLTPQGTHTTFLLCFPVSCQAGLGRSYLDFGWLPPRQV